MDALDRAFYDSFEFVEPTGKRFLLGIDVSGSMGWCGPAGMDCLTCAEGAAAMAMTIARTESKYKIMGFAHEFRDLGITASDSLQSALNKTGINNFGGTDCALPMIYAKENKLPVDCFVVLTDSETWFGDIHPCQALADYRRSMGIDSKLVVVGMEGNKFTIADSKDASMLDVVGFDQSFPTILAEFAKGNV